MRSLKQLATICIALPAALSVLSHKEVRFIYPILAPLQVIAAAPVYNFFNPIFTSQPQLKAENNPSNTLRSLLLLLLLSLNATIAIYTSQIHNSGILALPDYIRTEFQTHYNKHDQPQNLTLALLMPCHSTPWRSHLLYPGIQAWALTCEPPLHLTTPASKGSYLDEADQFYANPALWIRKTMSRHPPWTFSGLKDHERYHEPGLYADPYAGSRNKWLWSQSRLDPEPSSTSAQGLDITDLLPYLRTAPGKPPASETEDMVRRPWPHYLAFFGQLESTLMPLLAGSGYVECWRVFNSHWHDDWRRQGDVVVWCLFPDRVNGEHGIRGVKDGEEVVEEQEEQRDPRSHRVVLETPGKQRVVRIQ